MKKCEIIFAPLIRDPSFSESINYISQLSEIDLNFLLKTFLSTKYRKYYFIHISKFSKPLKLTESKAYSILRILDYIAYYVIQNFEIQDIKIAFDELKIKNIKNLIKILGILKNNKEDLDKYDTIDDEIGNINPHFRNITYTIQNRIVLKNNKRIENLPIVILQINTTSESEKENIVELLEDDLDALIEGLNTIKENLKTLKE